MRFRIAGLVLALALGVTACGGGDDITGSYDGPLLGTWAAVTIDGDSLPVRFEIVSDDVTCNFTILALQFTFLRTAQYTGQDQVTGSCGGSPVADLSRNFAGRFRTAGSALFLTEGQGAEQVSTFEVSGNTLIIRSPDDDGETVTVLRRQ